MDFLPGHERLIDEVLEIVGIAHTFCIEKDNFKSLQYIQNEAIARIDRILIEKILALSIKYRFLDDRVSLLNNYDRKHPRLGKYTIDDKKVEEIRVRTVLNKIIHHQNISLTVEHQNVTVLNTESTPGEIDIEPGHYTHSALILKLTGTDNKKNWNLNVNIFILFNEILRIEHLYAGNK